MSRYLLLNVEMLVNYMGIVEEKIMFISKRSFVILKRKKYDNNIFVCYVFEIFL